MWANRSWRGTRVSSDAVFTKESRVRLFLAFLILVLVLVNSQSLQLSYQSRATLTELFDRSIRDAAARLAAELERRRPMEAEDLNAFLEEVSRARGLVSACLLDWNARLVSGGACTPTEGGAFDRLDRDGKRRLLEEGFAATGVTPAYDVERARSFGYYVLNRVEGGDSQEVLRVEVSGARIAEANKSLRTTLVFQVSAMSLVLLAVILFLNSLLAPHRRLVAEARTVATEFSDGSPEEMDEGQFLLSTFQDIVQRLKQKERELAARHEQEKARADESQALASDIIRSMTTALVSLGPSGSIELVNPAAENVFGVEGERVQGRAFADVFPGSPELIQRVNEALTEGGSHLRGAVRYEKGQNETLHLGTSVIPLLSREGRPRGALCLLADLTEVVELRERLFLRNNLARLGEMASGIAHEFRNGLASIMGNAKLLEDPSAPDRDEILQALLDESRSLSRVVSEFLQFARPEPLHLEPVDLKLLASELVEELTPRAEAIAAEIVLRGDNITVELDELLFRKALSNLILNAIESLDESRCEGGLVQIELFRSSEAAFVRVRDNGPGVPPTLQEKIFHPFFTGKLHGTGLGLSVVQKIVVSHNGSIELEATEEGASFLVRLPLEPDSTRASGDWV
jgi:PAS domain S-box-containing protein